MWTSTANRVPDHVIRITIDNDEPARSIDQLAWASSIVEFLEDQDVADGKADVTISHLGTGSTILEVAFLGIAALANVGLFAVALGQYLQEADTPAAIETAQLTTNYGGTTVVIEAGQLEHPIVITAESLNGGQRVTLRPASTSEYLADESGNPLMDESGNPISLEAEKDGRADTVEQALEGTEETQRFGDMGLSDRVRIYEDESERITWMDSARGTFEVTNPEKIDDLDWAGEYLVEARLDTALSTAKLITVQPAKSSDVRKAVDLIGRVVTTHGGRFSLFRTGTSEYQIHEPDALYSTVPIGEDLRVRAEMIDADSIAITDWELLKEEAQPNWPPADDKSTFTNIPADEYVDVEGEFRMDGRLVYLCALDGTVARVDEILTERPLPMRMSLSAKAKAVRGDRGGYADRGISLAGWALLQSRYDPEQLAKPRLSAVLEGETNLDRVKLLFAFGEMEVPVFVSGEALADLVGSQSEDVERLIEIAKEHYQLIGEAVSSKLSRGMVQPGGVQISSADLN